ncbi:MAG: pre-peptidase C-terminal domain-containing protein [Planctomycetota bacterium]
MNDTWSAVVPVVSVVALGSSLASGQIIFESEPNDTIATADFATTFEPLGGSVAIDGTITNGDVDWFQIDVTAMTTLLFSAVASATDGADGQLMVVDGTGTDVLAFDDDSGPGLLPALQLFDLDAGTYYVGVSAFPDITFADDAVNTDTLFDGLDSAGAAHTGDFSYKLTISANLVPAPGVAAIFGAAAIATVRRRR